MQPRANQRARGLTKRAPRNHDGATRDRILREATGLFLERGYDAAAMSEIARRAGVTTPALYWHFASKSELCGEILARVYEHFRDELARRSVGTTAEQRLRAFAATYVELTIGDREMSFSVGYNDMRDKVSDAAQRLIDGAIRSVVDALKRILRDGQEDGAFEIADLTLTTYALLTMCEYVYVWYRPDGRLSPQEVGALYSDIAANLVRSPSGLGTLPHPGASAGLSRP